jgi:lipopolysaccharide transport system permease protein
MLKHLRALYAARDVLFTWTVREVKVRYTDTKLGIAWILIYPACWVFLFTALFSKLAPGGVEGVPYPLYVMCGLVPWFFFSNTLNNAVSSLKNNANLIPKVYFPREILPLGAVLVGLLDLCLYLVLVAAAMVYYRIGVDAKVLLVLPILLGLTMLTLALSLLASRFALFQREVQLLVPLVLQFMMYATPVFYSLGLVPARYQRAYLLNPIAGYMDSLRRVMLNHEWPRWEPFWSAIGVSVVLLLFAFYDFKRAEPEFADRL